MDKYYEISVKWKSGFKHKIYCRGYNLKSWLAFQESIFWIESYDYKEVNLVKGTVTIGGMQYDLDKWLLATV